MISRFRFMVIDKYTSVPHEVARRMKNGDVGDWGSNTTKASRVLAHPFAIVYTANAHASVWSREQAAVFSCECLGEWLNSRDFQESC